MTYKLVNERFNEIILIEPAMPQVSIGRAYDNQIVLSTKGYERDRKFTERYSALKSVSRHHGVFYQEPIEGGVILEFKDFSRFGSHWSMGFNGFKRVEGSIFLYPDCLLRLGKELEYKVVYSLENDVDNSITANLLRATTSTFKEAFKKTLEKLIKR